MTVYSDRFKYPAKGVAGGQDGTKAYIKLYHADGTQEDLPSKGSRVLNKGDRMLVAIGGGAGYGNPKDRPKEEIESDIRRKKVSLEKARELYGYQG